MGWLESTQLDPARAVPAEHSIANDAWRLMGGQLDWSAVEVVAEMFGVTDIEWLIVQLATIRDFHRARRD